MGEEKKNISNTIFLFLNIKDNRVQLIVIAFGCLQKMEDHILQEKDPETS